MFHFVEKVTDITVARKLLNLAQSAKDRGLDFNLSFKTVKRLMETQRCFYTNVEFTEDGPYQRTFDRVDAALGYVEGNVVACTNEINGKKVNLTVAEIEMLYKQIQKHMSKRSQK